MKESPWVDQFAFLSLSLSLPCGSPEEMQLLGQELLGFAVFLDLARGR